METTTIEFQYSARVSYTAVKNIVRRQTKFSNICCNDDLFTVEARHGMFLSPFSENVKIKVVATGTASCRVVIESSSRSMLNLLNFGANSDNVSDLSDFINNEVYRLTQTSEIKLNNQTDHSTIHFKQPDIRFKS